MSGLSSAKDVQGAAEDEKKAVPTKNGGDDDDVDDDDDASVATSSREEDDEVAGLSPEQEAEQLAEATARKAEANALFGRGLFDAALTAYETAAAVLPVRYDYDLAVLQSNMAACHLKTEAWKEAVKAATKALEALERDKSRVEKEKERRKTTSARPEVEDKDANKDEDDEDDEDVEDEIISAGASKAAPAPPTPAETAVRDRERIRVKALLRRARARAELGGWANLSGAEEDYRVLAALGPGSSAALTAADRRLVQAQLRQLPARTKAAQEAEMGEMWGKLKELGNGILRPFGMSTDNFKVVKDEKTGGYSMNFQQGSGQ